MILHIALQVDLFNDNEVVRALAVIFFSVFVITAIITICSLPGWIKIEE